MVQLRPNLKLFTMRSPPVLGLADCGDSRQLGLHRLEQTVSVPALAGIATSGCAHVLPARPVRTERRDAAVERWAVLGWDNQSRAGLFHHTRDFARRVHRRD